MHNRGREFSLVHGKSDNNFYIILSIHGHGLKQLALGGYSSGFVHIILSVAETVKLLSYELVRRALLSSYISENIIQNMLHSNEKLQKFSQHIYKSAYPHQSNKDFEIQNCY